MKPARTRRLPHPQPQQGPAWGPLLALVLGVGCKGDAPAWLMQHGTVDLSADGIAGYQVWEVFSKPWARKRSAKQHICAHVQTLQGAEDGDLDGCSGCTVTYAIRTEALESDCAGAAAELAGIDAVTHFAFGPVADELKGQEPYPGDSLGWYASFDGRTLEPMGFAWNAALDDGDPPLRAGLVEGERFVFWPAFAWDVASVAE